MTRGVNQSKKINKSKTKTLLEREKRGSKELALQHLSVAGVNVKNDQNASHSTR